ncbi:MAG: YHS domain-containing protein [Acidobacteria bacterium]|nr:YHS domain-containing protein [Acidobacteriota bacterium]
MRQSRTYLAVALAVLGVLLAGCVRETAADEGTEVEITTIENSPTEMRPVRKPPTIEFDAGPLPSTADQAVPAERDGEETEPDEDVAPWVQNLPFSPKIAMDPVDGSKISIRGETPIAEYKGRIYYFSSEANRREFIRNPDSFLSGAFASY